MRRKIIFTNFFKSGLKTRIAYIVTTGQAAAKFSLHFILQPIDFKWAVLGSNQRPAD